MTLRQALEAIWPVAGVAILWSGVLAVFASAAGWQQRQRSRRRPAQLEFPDRIPPGRIGFEADILDIAAEARAMLRRFQSLAAQQLVRLEMAVHPGLAIQADQRAFREILGDLVRRSIEQSPCGRILLTAAWLDGCVRLSVSDDGPGADGATEFTRLRGAERLIALQGGSKMHFVAFLLAGPTAHHHDAWRHPEADLLSGGRVAWNAVASDGHLEARDFGRARGRYCRRAGCSGATTPAGQSAEA